MAHATQREFIEVLSDNIPNFFCNCRVLEIGSLDINGSIRDFFKNCDYIGLDIGSGKGVDIVCEGQKYDAPDNSFDQVISCEVMEHNPHWLKTTLNMIRLCRPGGLVVITCATTGRPEHGTTRTTADDSPLTTDAGWEYYKNLTKDDFLEQLSLDSNFSAHFISINWASYDLIFFGIKSGGLVNGNEDGSITSAIRAVDAYVTNRNRELICRVRSLFAAIFGDRGFEIARSFRSTMQPR
ncbi:MAG: class I SAM-dependent methyltransferase [Azonexaceae bacterium]|nr:class I SAM-dependent methyltransferase [Azonexaceae bacterium]